MMQYPSIAWNLMRMLKPLACKKIQELPAISHENNGIKNNKRPLISARRLYRFLKRSQQHSTSAGSR